MENRIGTNGSYVTLVLAADLNGGIGLNNTIPWRSKDDMKNFKRVTLNKIVVMGRKTAESLGLPLPNRTNLVLTRDRTWLRPGFTPVYDLESVFYKARGKQVMVIGGSEIYKLFWDADIVDTVLLTRIQGVVESDTNVSFLDTELRDEFHVVSSVPLSHHIGDTHAATFHHFERAVDRHDPWRQKVDNSFGADALALYDNYREMFLPKLKFKKDAGCLAFLAATAGNEETTNTLRRVVNELPE